MDISQYFPIWGKLAGSEQNALRASSTSKTVEAGIILHSGSADCVGLYLVCHGQLRAYILSPDGKEVTLYRLFDRDICLFSAACMMASIQFEIFIEAEKKSDLIMIPTDTYKSLMAQSAPLSNYTNEIMASRFSDVMWLIDQIMWNSFDRRLANFLVEERNLDETDTLLITHEKIANHLGTAREVVTRMLKYFQSEGMVALSRGGIKLTDIPKLEELAASRKS